jgi:MoxR-like ATPase
VDAARAFPRHRHTESHRAEAGRSSCPRRSSTAFLLCHRLDYPTVAEEEDILRRQLALGLRREAKGAVPQTSFDLLNEPPVASVEELTDAMAAVQAVHVSEVFTKHAVELVRRTRRNPSIEIGGSPRAGIALSLAARARAYIHGRDYAVPEDLYALAEDVLLHRMRLTYEALAEGVRAATVLRGILAEVG